MDIYEKIIKSGFGEKIIKAIHTNIDNDVNELINYLDEESKEYCTKDLREKYAKILRELIDDIYNSNQEMIKILINEKICESGIDIEIVNRRRLLLKKLNECFVYGAYSGRFFYDMYWIYVKSRKSDEAVIIKRRSPFLEPSNTGINFSIEEDNIGLRKKRRAEDIKKLRQMFSYYIDKSSAERVTESDEFNDLWDIVDCYIFKYEEISHNIVTSAKENSRKKTVLNFWRLFGQTEGVERKYVFKKGMPLDLLNNERNNNLPIEYPYQKIMSSIICDLEYYLGTKYNYCDCYIWYQQVVFSWRRKFISFRNKIDNYIWQAIEKNSISVLEETDIDFGLNHFMKENVNNVIKNYLLCLAKIYVLNDLYGLEYVLGDYRRNFRNAHAKIIMKKITNDEGNAYRELFKAVKDKKNMVLSYKDIKGILLSNDIYDKLKVFLPKNADIQGLCKDAEKIMKYIISPCIEKITLHRFIILMQCCASSANSSLIINHYGMKHGKIKEVKLSTIMRQPKKNRFKEVNVFVSHLMRRRDFLNIHLLSIEDVDIIDKFILRQYKIVYDFVSKIRSWEELRYFVNNEQN